MALVHYKVPPLPSFPGGGGFLKEAGRRKTRLAFCHMHNFSAQCTCSMRAQRKSPLGSRKKAAKCRAKKRKLLKDTRTMFDIFDFFLSHVIRTTRQEHVDTHCVIFQKNKNSCQLWTGRRGEAEKVAGNFERLKAEKSAAEPKRKLRTLLGRAEKVFPCFGYFFSPVA